MESIRSLDYKFITLFIKLSVKLLWQCSIIEDIFIPVAHILSITALFFGSLQSLLSQKLLKKRHNKRRKVSNLKLARCSAQLCVKIKGQIYS